MAREWKDYDIVGSYNNQRYSEIDAERSINCFEYRDPSGKKKKSLINTSGLINTETNYSGFGITGGFRKQFVFNGFYYSVIGNSIVRQDPNNTISLLGNISTSTGYVGIDANTYQVIFVDGQHGYIWDTTASTFVMITDPAFPSAPNGNPIDVCYLDGFFLVALGGTPKFRLSSFNQGLIWGPDNNGTQTSFVVAPMSADLVLTYHGATIANYQLGTIVTLSGGALPAEMPAGNYYVVALVGPSTIRISATDGGTPISSVGDGNGDLTNNGQLQEGQISSHPGNIVACRTLHRRIFLFSEFFTEVWENAGLGTNLPFRRNNALLMEYGTPAIGSISTSFDIMCFQSQTKDGLGPVVMVRGTQAIPISTTALDFQLAQYAQTPIPLTPTLNQITDCVGFLILENGLIFYRMNFTSANHTFVYDVTLSRPETGNDSDKLWHEEEVLNGNRHPAQTHAYFNGSNYVGDYLSPILYQVDANTVTNNGQSIRRARIPRPIVPETYQRIRVDRLHIDMLQGQINMNPGISTDAILFTESGLEIDTESGQPIIAEILSGNINTLNPPEVFLSLSRDGAQSFNFQTVGKMGRVGDRTFRTVFRKLGASPRGQAFQPKIEFYSQTPFVILGASWVYEIMPE